MSGNIVVLHCSVTCLSCCAYNASIGCFSAEVLVTKHFIPAAFGVLLFCVLVITKETFFLFLPYGILAWIRWLWTFFGLLLPKKHCHFHQPALDCYLFLCLEIWKLATMQLVQFVSVYSIESWNCQYTLHEYNTARPYNELETQFCLG